MPAFHVSTSVRIERPLVDVQRTIGDFTTWPVWSPWLRMEPDASIDYHGDAAQPGHGYRWEGRKVGSGSMRWQRVLDNELHAELRFLKPFKSTANVAFVLTDHGDTTDVEWRMDSALPFFMFFMVKRMSGMITMDYRRGLALLKDQLELGRIVCNIESIGVVQSDAVSYLGVTRTVEMEAISDSMEESFGKVYQAFCESGKTQSGITAHGNALAIYHTMNVADQRCRYTAALPVDDGDRTCVPDTATHTLESGTVAAGRAYKVVFTGPYRHLGNAWAMALSDIRHQKLTLSRRHKPYERYMNEPGSTKEDNLVTEIIVPLK